MTSFYELQLAENEYVQKTCNILRLAVYMFENISDENCWLDLALLSASDRRGEGQNFHSHDFNRVHEKVWAYAHRVHCVVAWPETPDMPIHLATHVENRASATEDKVIPACPTLINQSQSMCRQSVSKPMNCHKCPLHSLHAGKLYSRISYTSMNT